MLKFILSFLLLIEAKIKSPVTPNWRASKRADASSSIHRQAKLDIAITKYTTNHKRMTHEPNDENTLILEWWNFGLPYLQKMPESCGGCWTTNNRNKEFVADGIMFDNTRFKSATKLNDLPTYEKRNLDSQYWIFWPREAASKGIEKGTTYSCVKDWDSAFNLTASYRRDSDILRPFGSLDALAEKHLVNGKPQNFDEIKSHIMSMKESPNGKHTAWIVSNCARTNGAKARWAYGQELIKNGLKLDGFGECFGHRLQGVPWNDNFGEGKINKYKFYLAFENSIHCNDYISEKFWRNSLNTGAVPVIYGPYPADVAAVAPKNSYIHVENFASPKELVEYLDYLDSNDTAYAEFHRWRTDPVELTSETGLSNTGHLMCNMCKAVKERKLKKYPKKIIKSVASWWWVNVHDDLCTSDYVMPGWVKAFPPVTIENSYDELKLKFTAKDQSKAK